MKPWLVGVIWLLFCLAPFAIAQEAVVVDEADPVAVFGMRLRVLF